MKIRDGFVSNSSSTSFTVVLNKDAEGVNVRIFDFLTKFLGNGFGIGEDNGKIKRSTVDEKRALVKDELDVFKKDRAYLTKKLKLIESYLKDKRLVAIFEEAHNEIIKIEHIRYEREHEKENRASGYTRDEITRTRNQLVNKINEIDKRTGDLGKQLVAIAPLAGDSVLVSWTEDNWGELRYVVDEMLRDGMLTVVERIGT